MKSRSSALISLLLIALLFAVATSLARPRPPLPPLPMRGELFVWRFDQAPWAFGPFRAPSVEHNVEFAESWNGHALRMDGDQPRLLRFPEFDSTGQTNITCDHGSVRFWFRPNWSSAQAGGVGPGASARLIEVGAWTEDARYGWWSLYVSPEGDTIQFSTQGGGQQVDYLAAPIGWLAGEWHELILTYSAKASVLYVDGELAADGPGILVGPAANVRAEGFCVGSDGAGGNLAQGEFDELGTYNRPLLPRDILPHFSFYHPWSGLGPITPEEDAERRAAATKTRAEREASLPGGGQQMLRMIGSSSECVTNVPVYITNVVAAFDTNDGWVVTFDIQGGTNGLFYDIFVTTNLLGDNATNSHWFWLERGPSCSTYQYKNQPATYAFYVLGTPQDTDGDGQTDAIEQLISKTDPLVGENRIQTENAITGTTNWMLANPATPGWPTSATNTTPEIEGFASETSVNVGNAINLYVDVRNGDPNYTLEIYRLGWYGGLGGRAMTWYAGGVPTNRVALTSQKQPIPVMNTTNGLIDCLNQSASSNNWQNSYTLAVPTNWVSGVYVAKLTTGTNTTLQTTNKQSYIIFTVREDARSSAFLVQQSVTTWQAYNPWGGSSLYYYPRCLNCNFTPNEPDSLCNGELKVSFNRPYAASCNASLGYGTGAGEFLTMINYGAMPAWEYNMVRWLERQGYDATYATSIDTHRGWPAGKNIKAFLSVGHDEYWSASMRANVEAARDRGVNLAFFGANVSYFRAVVDAGDQAFSVIKNYTDYAGLWRVPSQDAEISMVGVEYVSASLTNDVMKLKYPLATASGTHWTFDYISGLTNEANRFFPGLLGYEVDGSWDGVACNSIPTPAPATNTLILADSVFNSCASGTGHTYMTIYTAPVGSQIFAAGTLQWNWGLDNFGSQFAPRGTSLTHTAAQQMTHNVLCKFASRDTAPVIYVNADADTSGNWTNRYGADGHWIADTTSLTNLPDYAQVTFTNQHVQVWTNQSTDSRALLKPQGLTNRIASAWTTTNTQGSTYTIDLNLTDTNTHQVALYCVDWLGTGTVLQKVEVFESSDTSYSHPLDARSFQLPANGVYLVWKLNGHKVIRITKPDATTGNKAMVSAIFFGIGS